MGNKRNEPNTNSGARNHRYVPKFPFLTGFLTGGLEICITYPFEYTKVQIQLSPNKQSMRQVAVNTLNRHGFIGFYNGLSSWLLFSFPRSASRFKTFEKLQEYFHQIPQLSLTLKNMSAGTVAGAVESFFLLTPMQCLQIKMNEDFNSKNPKFRGLFGAMIGILRREGLWRGFFSGVWPTVWKGMLNNCIRFTVYNELMSRDLTQNKESTEGQRVLKTLGSGAIAGGISAFATHPIDTVKSNMQSFEGSKYITSYQCFSTILQSSGVNGLYRGFSPRLVRVCLEISLQFTFYEQIGKLIDQS